MVFTYYKWIGSAVCVEHESFTVMLWKTVVDIVVEWQFAGESVKVAVNELSAKFIVRDGLRLIS